MNCPSRADLIAPASGRLEHYFKPELAKRATVACLEIRIGDTPSDAAGWCGAGTPARLPLILILILILLLALLGKA
jgi:hypothetical protein